MMRPLYSMAMRSAILRALAMSWVIEIAVAPRLAHAFDDQIVDDVGHDRIEAGGRLVEEDDLGLGGDGARQADALLHAARQFGRPQLGRLRGRARPRASFSIAISLRLRARHAAALDQAERDILPDAAANRTARALEQHAEFAASALRARRARSAGDLLAVDLDRAGIGLEQAEDAFDQHRFAGARAADDDEALAGAAVEIDAVEHDLAPERLAQPRYRDLRVRRQPRSSARKTPASADS